MYIAKLPLDTSRAFEVRETDSLKNELFDKLKNESPDASDDQLNELTKKQIDKLIEDGYKEFVFSEKPIVNEGETAVLSFEERDDKIYQTWTIEIDIQFYQKQIEECKSKLSASDYKIIKSYEAQLVGDALPYNITELREQRQSLRDEIHEFEKRIKSE